MVVSPFSVPLFLGSVLDSGTCFWILGRVLDSGRCFGFWEVFCPYEPPYEIAQLFQKLSFFLLTSPPLSHSDRIPLLHSMALTNLRWSLELLIELRLIVSSYFHSASQSCPLLSANQCTFRHIWHLLFRGDRSGMNKSSSATGLFIQWCFWKRKSHLAKEKSGRGRRRSREKANQGVGDFRFITITIFFFQLLYFIISFFTLFTHDIYSHPHPHLYPLPTTHDI